MSPFSAPVFLHLVHPYSLKKLVSLVGHIRTLRDYVLSLNPSTENSRLAKDVLIDVVDNCGVILDKVEPTLTDLLKDASTMNSERSHTSPQQQN